MYHSVRLMPYGMSGDGGNQTEKDGKGCSLQYKVLGAYGCF